MIYIILKFIPGVTKIRINGINYYGPAANAEDFKNAINNEIPKYDTDISDRIKNNQIEINIFYSNNQCLYTPTVGSFIVPKWVFDHGSEGICQFIVYCVIGIDDAGVGLPAQIRLLERQNKPSYSYYNKKMRSWIKEKRFPEHWLSSYE